MKRLAFTLLVLIFFTECKKSENSNTNPNGPALNPNTIILSDSVLRSSLILVDSAQLVFDGTGTGINKIKVGSILVSDTSKLAPFGFLRKVTSITTNNGNIICTTEQASLTDAITNADVNYSRNFTDNDIMGLDTSGIDISAIQAPVSVQNLSFIFPYAKVLYDADGNLQTKDDQITVGGEIDIEPTFNFSLKISGAKVQKLLIELNLKNTNKINFESKTTLASLQQQKVIATFALEPFTIWVAGVPIPIAKNWIALVIGVDGNISARVTAGAQDINTVDAGVDFENGTWNNINTINNSLTLLPLTFEGAATIEPWLQVRYEIRPYGIPQSRIYVGARGSIIGEASLTPAGLSIDTKWGVQLSALAQVQLFDKSLLNYNKIFYENEYPISQISAFAFPALSTTATSAVTGTTAQCGGNITSDGGAPVTARGVCWSTSSNPTIANYITKDGTGTGTFTSSLTGLTPNTTFHVRAYATNSAGTAYGNDLSFSTSGDGIIFNPNLTYGTLTDIDGNIYKTIQIGTQTWMAENLKVNHYSNGDAIPNVTDDTLWSNLVTGGWCYYNNDAQNNIPYGKLYNWYAVTDTRNIAPNGWHVPSDAEWTVLINYLGGLNVAGGKMKEIGSTHWGAQPIEVDNSSGFTFLPGAFRFFNGGFELQGYEGWIWSTTDSTTNIAWDMVMLSNLISVGRDYDNKKAGFSIRCVKD